MFQEWSSQNRQLLSVKCLSGCIVIKPVDHSGFQKAFRIDGSCHASTSPSLADVTDRAGSVVDFKLTFLFDINFKMRTLSHSTSYSLLKTPPTVLCSHTKIYQFKRKKDVHNSFKTRYHACAKLDPECFFSQGLLTSSSRIFWQLAKKSRTTGWHVHF